MELHQRKQAEASRIAAAANQDLVDFANAMVLYRKRLTEHAIESEKHRMAMVEHKAQCMQVEAFRIRDFGSTSAEAIAQMVAPMVRVTVVVEHAMRETRVMVPGTGRLVTLEERPVDGRGRVGRSRVARIADRIAGWIPRRNEFLFAYRLSCRVRIQVVSPHDLADALNELLSLSALRAAGIIGKHDWRILPKSQCEAILVAAASGSVRHTITVESEDPEAIGESLVPLHQLQGESLARFVLELRQGAEQALGRYRLPVPLELPHTPYLPLPHPGHAPKAPRALPGSLGYWSLPWEAIYRLEGLDVQVPGRGDILLGYSYSKEDQALVPMRIPRQQLHSHVHLTGATRSGKTTMLAAIIVQLIRGSDEAVSRKDEVGEPPPILIVDPKGDLGLYHTAKIEAQKRGQRFHAFVATASLHSGHIDIFGTILRITTNPDEIAGLLARALDLHHGAEYGKGHFGRLNSNLLAQTAEQLGKAVKDCQEGGTGGLSFSILIEKLKELAKRDGVGASEAVNALEPLARMDRLWPRTGAAPEDAIDLWRVVEERQVVYVYADQFGGTRNLDVMRLVIFLLNLVCQKRKECAKDRRVYAVIDEFKDVLSTNLGTVISTAAGNGLSLLMANQSVAQLRSGDIDVAAELSSNVNLRIFLTADSAEDIEDIQRLSGESPQWFSNIGVSASTGNTIGSSTSSTWGRSESRSSGVTNSFTRMWSEFQTRSVSQTRQETTIGASEGSSEGHGVGVARKSEAGTSQSVGGTDSKSRQDSASDGSSLSFTETPRPTVNINEILATASRQLACFLWVRHDIEGRDSLGGRLIAVQALRCLDPDEYRARDRTPWPRCEGEAREEVPSTQQQPLAAGAPPKVPGAPAKAAAADMPDDRAAQSARLKFLFEAEYQIPVNRKDKKP